MQPLTSTNPKRNSRRLFLTLMLVGILLGGGPCLGAIEINIGANNVVNTNTVTTSTSSGCVQGSGTVKEESRSLPPFHALDVDGAFAVTITCQKDQSVKLSADDNLLPLIVTDVVDGTLRVTTRKSICTSSPMTLVIRVENLDQIRSGGANNFQVNDVKSSALDVRLSGSGNMTLAGQARELTAALDGASEIHATALRAERATVSISGAGSAEVHASESLQADISGVGNIRYAGNPKQVVRNISGWGEITPLGQ